MGVRWSWVLRNSAHTCLARFTPAVLQILIVATSALAFLRAPSFGQTITVDNTDPEFHVLSGNWVSSTNATGYYGSDYLWRSASPSGIDAVEWRPVLPTTGLYEIAVRYTSGSNRADNAVYTIQCQDGSVAHTVNQQLYGRQWLVLGTYPFVAGDTGWVRLSNRANPNVVIADAVHFRLRLASVPACESDEIDAIAAAAQLAYRHAEDRFDMDTYAGSTDAGVLAWHESYILDAFVGMYEGTHDMQYLDRLMDHADLIFANRGDRIGMICEIRGRMLPAWIATPRHELPSGAWLVHEGLITSPIARWIYLVKRDPNLRLQYASKPDQYLADIIQAVDAFDEEVHPGPNPGELYYQFPEGSPADPMPYNQQNAIGSTYVTLWLITGEERFRVRAEGLALFFRNRLVPVQERYDWGYSTATTSGEDIGHAAINVDFAFQCYRAGLVFDAADMQRFARTLAFISNGPAGFDDRVNGGDIAAEDKSPSSSNWMRLGFIEPGLRPVYYEYFTAQYTAMSSVYAHLGASRLVETAHPFMPAVPLPGPDAARIWTDRSCLVLSCDRFYRPPDDLVVMRNSGVGSLQYGIASDSDWLTVTPVAGSIVCGQETVTVHYGVVEAIPQEPGEHIAHLTISADDPAVPPAVVEVHLIIVPFVGDFERDGDVDAVDLEMFNACSRGPFVDYSNGCEAADFDNDRDVDLDDFGVFQRCYGGEDVHIASDCADGRVGPM